MSLKLPFLGKYIRDRYVDEDLSPKKQAMVDENLQRAQQEDREKIAEGFLSSVGDMFSSAVGGDTGGVTGQTGGSFSTAFGPRAMEIAKFWHNNPGSRAAKTPVPRGGGAASAPKPQKPQKPSGSFGSSLRETARSMTGAGRPSSASAATKTPKAPKPGQRR